MLLLGLYLLILSTQEHDLHGVANGVGAYLGTCHCIVHALYHVGALLEHIERRTMNQIVRYLFSVQRKAIAKGITENL